MLNRPENAAQAFQRMLDGNLRYIQPNHRMEPKIVHMSPSSSFSAGDTLTEAPAQSPFAAVLSCADARVPVELLFSQGSNDLFVLRVAGNILSAENLGSLHYAVEHIPSIHLLVILGHSGCGAVTAAAQIYRSPALYFELGSNPALRSLVDHTLPYVRFADSVLLNQYGENAVKGDRQLSALVDMASVLHAAQTAAVVRSAFAGSIGINLEVVYGFYDLNTCRVGLSLDDSVEPSPSFAVPPENSEAFLDFAEKLAASTSVRRWFEI